MILSALAGSGGGPKEQELSKAHRPVARKNVLWVKNFIGAQFVLYDNFAM
jgi:hypothetical protein